MNASTRIVVPEAWGSGGTMVFPDIGPTAPTGAARTSAAKTPVATAISLFMWSFPPPVLRSLTDVGVRRLPVVQQPFQRSRSRVDGVRLPDRVGDALLPIGVDPYAHSHRLLRDPHDHDGWVDQRTRDEQVLR